MSDEATVKLNNKEVDQSTLEQEKQRLLQQENIKVVEVKKGEFKTKLEG